MTQSKKPADAVATEPFCYWHIKTKENQLGTDCSAHLDEGRCDRCPYKSVEDSQKREFPCVDYEPLKPEKVEKFILLSDLRFAVKCLLGRHWISPAKAVKLEDKLRREERRGQNLVRWEEKA